MTYTIDIDDMCFVAVTGSYDRAVFAHDYLVNHLLPGHKVRLRDGDEVIVAAESPSSDALGDVLTDLLAVNDKVIEWAAKMGSNVDEDEGPFWDEIVDMAVKVRMKIAARN
jgi:hypothetical protein